jgi:hypothetical protein
MARQAAHLLVPIFVKPEEKKTLRRWKSSRCAQRGAQRTTCEDDIEP